MPSHCNWLGYQITFNNMPSDDDKLSAIHNIINQGIHALDSVDITTSKAKSW